MPRDDAIAPVPSGPSAREALGAEALEERLDELLWAALSSRRSASAAARALATLPRAAQDLSLHWVEVVENSNAEMAFQLASHAHEACSALGLEGLEDWIVHAMDVYDRSGLYAAVDIFRNVAEFRERMRVHEVGVALKDVQGMLEHFVHGLSGRRLRLETGAESYTDTESLYLPEVASRYARRADNFRLLKATAVFLWAQTRFGTWRVEVFEALSGHPDRARTVGLFQALEGLRLTACIARELPGVYREIRALTAPIDEPLCPPGWEGYRDALGRPSASVRDSLALLRPLVESGTAAPACLCFQGRMRPDQVEEVFRCRVERERQDLGVALARLRDELSADRPGPPPPTDEPFSVRRAESDEPTEGLRLELFFEDTPVAPPEAVQEQLASILLDLGEIPPSYLTPAGDGAYHPAPSEEEEEDPSASAWSGTYHERGAHHYPEWDFRRQHYRKDWCVLREVPLEPATGTFVSDTLARYARHLVGLRKTFEALRGEDRRLRKEPYGDEVDLDALIEAHADAHRGMEISDRLFTRMHKVERNIAVMFMVDMSGSTRGWINEAERESLVLLCEALETLGDRYAIYGFSGMTRKRCEVYRIKRFDEGLGEEVRGRIAGIEPKDYTRMGVAIRHLAGLLNRVEARTRLLITLSDGKPDDYGDEYRGEYGIEDTRRALIEAKRDGVHPFCITIDREAQSYLPHMYGAVNYTIVDSVARLPYKVSEIYRRLTT